MIRNLVLLVCSLLLPHLVFAFNGDYVWEEKFKQQLPVAEKGDATAQYNVGVMYFKGRGTDKNLENGFQWFLKAAEQGHEKASYRVGLSYLHGKGVTKDENKALKWLNLASNKGYERAHFALGEIYENGLGVSKDLNAAQKWYQKALDGGYAPAREHLTNVKEQRLESEADKRKTELAAARNQLVSNRAKPESVSIKEPQPTIKQILLQGGWKKSDKPAEYLPSTVSNCKQTGTTIECLSQELKRNIGIANIQYTTKSILFSIKDTGEFKISYRNNVTKIDVTDMNYSKSGAKIPITLGWQDAEHALTCKIKNAKEIECEKDKLRTVKYRR